MPGQGSTLRECVVCHAQLNVACKICKTCKAAQPHKLRLKKKIEKFDKKRESWVNTHMKNRTASHICDEGYILLEKLQALGVRAVLFISKPGRKPDSWVSEVLAPRCQLSETSTTCLERMKSLYDIVIQGWLPQGTIGQLGEPSSTPVDPPAGPPMASPDSQVPVALNPPAATVAPNAHTQGEPSPTPADPQVGPPMATPDFPVPVVLDPPAASVATVTMPPLTSPPVTRPPLTTPPMTRPPLTRPPLTTPPLTRPPLTRPPLTTPPLTTPAVPTPPVTRPPVTTSPAAQTGLLAASAGPHAALTGSPAHRTQKKKECPHTVAGSQDFYPVKRFSKCKVIKGKKMKLVEWEPCKLCGKKWPLEWVLDEDTC